MDVSARRATFPGLDLGLTPTELDVLGLLMSNRDIVLTPAVIYDRIWGYDFGPDSKNLAVFVSSLRSKLQQAGAPAVISTVRGTGYVVRSP